MTQSLLTLLVGVTLSWAAPAQSATPARPAAPVAKPRSSPPVDRTKMNASFQLAGQMNAFRLGAGAMADRAIEVWGSPEFQSKWAKEVRPMFPRPEDLRQLHDFFSSAVVLLGRIENGSGVAAFYNPWQDGLLLVAATPGADHPVLTDFRFVAGETWRGEKVTTGLQLLSLYRLEEPLTLALAKRYSATIDRFTEWYPVHGPFQFLPDAVRRIAGSNLEELVPIRARMAYRAGMFQTLMAAESREAVQVARDLRALLAEGKPERLQAYLAPAQNAEMLETLLKLPAAFRRNLSPNYLVRNPSRHGSLLALVNSEMPRTVFAIQILDAADNGKPSVTLEALDLEQSHRIISQLRNAQ